MTSKTFKPPSNFEHVMVDLETLGLAEDSIILSVGAVKFNYTDDDTWESLAIDSNRSFYAVLDIEEQQEGLLRSSNQETIDWWGLQEDSAKEAIFKADTALSMLDFADAFNQFAGGTKFLWGNGAGFDCNKLRHLYYQLDIAFPYAYYCDMDLRTAKLLLNPTRSIEVPSSHIDHHALSDARLQVLRLQSWTREDKLWRKDRKPGSVIQ